MLTLGIETSCDETSVALTDGKKVLSNAVTSSVHLHSRFGGVVPEIASRHHVEYINHVLSKALKASKAGLKDVRLVAVTKGPGLVGSLLVGIQEAKAISYALKVPIIGINHILAHLYSVFMDNGRKDLRFPFIGLVVSGGHTSIYLCKGVDTFRLLGQTQDDALGEAYDKVAKVLSLGYPGGPVVERRARLAKKKEKFFPKTYLGKGSLDFSFSGIKTAVLYYARGPKKVSSGAIKLSDQKINEIAFAFQESVLDVVVDKTIWACERSALGRIVVGGGVSANQMLRQKFFEAAEKRRIKMFFPPLKYCTDNAAMVAGYGEALFKKGKRSDLYFTADANLKI
ncbi:tRNA (adenosine(37)-N6)-threonylcarbamoyltransferase complex transferase subunit TsaD [Candidatus Omnitrophota bacterium]